MNTKMTDDDDNIHRQHCVLYAQANTTQMFN